MYIIPTVHMISQLKHVVQLFKCSYILGKLPSDAWKKNLWPSCPTPTALDKYSSWVAQLIDRRIFFQRKLECSSTQLQKWLHECEDETMFMLKFLKLFALKSNKHIWA